MFSFLAHKAAAPIALAIAILSLAGNALLGSLYWAETRHSDKLAARVTSLSGNLATCRGNVTTLQGAADAQNAGVAAVKAAADAAAAGARAGQAAAEIAAEAHDRAAATITKEVIPAGMDSCLAAAALIDKTTSSREPAK